MQVKDSAKNSYVNISPVFLVTD